MLIFFLIGWKIIISTTVISIKSPPQIVDQPPNGEILFETGHNTRPIVLECRAKGEPNPTYEWYKNDQPYKLDVYDQRLRLSIDSGRLTIASILESDQGDYKCLASNKYGKAMTNVVRLRKSYLLTSSVRPPISVTAHKDAPFTIQCQAPDGYPKPAIVWMKMIRINPNLISVTSSRIILGPNGSLMFSTVFQNDTSHDSHYVCLASSTNSEFKVVKRINMTVIDSNSGQKSQLMTHPPKPLYLSDSRIVGILNEKLRLWCIYSGYPLGIVKWTVPSYLNKDGRNSTEVGPNHKYGYYSTDSWGRTLDIKRIQWSHAGIYNCHINNGVSEPEMHRITVTIQARPYFTTEPQVQITAENETAKFVCIAGGLPKPRIIWIRNGERLDLDKWKLDSRHKVKTNSLVLKNLRENDTANYGCNASNVHGYVYKDVHLNIVKLPAEITHKPMNRRVVIGNSTMFTCRVFGSPSPTIKWYFQGLESKQRIRKQLNNNRKHQIRHEILTITNVVKGDTGNYTCIVTNRYGKEEANATLEVLERSVIKTAVDRVTVESGDAVTLFCEVQADTQLSVSVEWLSALNMDYTRFIQNKDNSLTITRATVSDAGDYQCIANTEIDRATKIVSLIVKDVPDAPSLYDGRCRNESVRLFWKPNSANNDNITGFTIEFITGFVGSEWSQIAQVPVADIREYLVTLSPWTNYTLRMRAVNSVGISLPSPQNVTCDTSENSPEKNPEVVEARGTNPHNMVIKWKPLERIDHNAPGLYYILQWRQHEWKHQSSKRWNETKIENWKQDSIVISELPTYVRYQIRMYAYNRQGKSRVDSVVYNGWSGEDVPIEAPSEFNITEIIDGRSAIFVWAHVNPDKVMGVFKGYKIQTWTDERKSKTETIIEGSTINTSLIDSLVPYNTNFARIFVFNSAYNGPYSKTIEFKMPEGTPTSVRSIEIFALSSTSMYLRWLLPREQAGVILGHKISYQRIQANRLAPIVAAHVTNGSETLTTIISSLSPDTLYRVHIVAFTNAGDGANSYVEQKTLYQDSSVLPGIPTTRWRYWHRTDDTVTIRVTWIPAVYSIPGSHFFVQYRHDGDSAWINTQVKKEKDYIFLKDLSRMTVYQLRTVSVNGELKRPSKTVLVNYDPQMVKAMNIPSMVTSPLFIICICLLLLLICTLFVLCIMRHYHVGIYNVQKRESNRGVVDLSTPFQDVNGTFSVSYQPDTANVEEKIPLESDTDSIVDYGDETTAGRFTEDGSFIGQYGTNPRRNSNGGVAYV